MITGSTYKLIKLNDISLYNVNVQKFTYESTRPILL